MVAHGRHKYKLLSVFQGKISLGSLASSLKAFIKHIQKTFFGPSGKGLGKKKK